MSMPVPPPVTSWQVTSTTETQEVDSAGSVVRGARVHFTTGTGQSASVFIPQAQLNVDNVRAAIAAKAALLDQVGTLTSGD